MKVRALAAAMFAGLAMMAATPAIAQPDPHMPDPQSNYCPGGGMGSMIYMGYCDGVPYVDRLSG